MKLKVSLISFILVLHSPLSFACTVGDSTTNETVEDPNHPSFLLNLVLGAQNGVLGVTKSVIFIQTTNCNPLATQSSPFYYFSQASSAPVALVGRGADGARIYDPYQDSSLYQSYLQQIKDTQARIVLAEQPLILARKARMASEMGKYDTASLCTEDSLPAYVGALPTIPVNDQGTLGICASEASVQAWDNFRSTQEADKGVDVRQSLTSPIYAAIVTSHTETPTENSEYAVGYSFEGNVPCDVLNFLSAAGSCSISANGVPVDNLSSTISLLKKNFFEHQNSGGDVANAVTDLERILQQNGLSQLAKKIQASPQIGTQLFAYKDFAQFLKGIFVDLCTPAERVRLSPPPVCRTQETFEGSPNALGDIVQDHFTNPRRQAQSLVAGICAEVMSNGPGFDPFYEPGHCTRHAVQIVGRRFNAGRGRCQVLIRNSGGMPTADDTNQAWEISGTNVWVDQGTLSHSLLFGVSWLEAK